MSLFLLLPLHALIIAGVDHVIRKIDEELRQTPFRGSVITKNR